MLSSDSSQRELFRLNRASRWQTITKLELPGAMPDLVTGARISSGLCVLGSIVGEYFAGAGSQQAGLGYLIFAAKDQFELDKVFAAVLSCTLLGVIIFVVAGWFGDRVLLHWKERDRGW
jgi:NitT/TauT family transport system permease protein